MNLLNFCLQYHLDWYSNLVTSKFIFVFIVFKLLMKIYLTYLKQQLYCSLNDEKVNHIQLNIKLFINICCISLGRLYDPIFLSIKMRDIKLLRDYYQLFLEHSKE